MPMLASPYALMMALGSGLASAVLFASVIAGTTLALPLSMMSALPIVIAALGWGTRAGILASIVAGAVVAAGLTGLLAAVHLAWIAFPAVVASHLIGLARVEGDHVEWYPLGRVLVASALIMAVLAVIIGSVYGYAPEKMLPPLAGMFAEMSRAPGDTTPIETLRVQYEPVLRLMLRILPVVIPIVWTVVLVLNLWLGAKVVARSDRLARPWEDLSAVRAPGRLGVAYGVAVAGTALPDPIGLFAGPFFGALSAVYTLIGLAVVHNVTRDAGPRPIVLATVYGLLFLIPFAALVPILIGLLDPVFKFRDRRRNGPPAAT